MLPDDDDDDKLTEVMLEALRGRGFDNRRDTTFEIFDTHVSPSGTEPLGHSEAARRSPDAWAAPAAEARWSDGTRKLRGSDSSHVGTLYANSEGCKTRDVTALTYTRPLLS